MSARKKAWVEQLLSKREAIESAIGMPLGAMLGCGHWGCVFESTAPWVVKLSIDPTEGPIWSKIAGLVREEVWGTQGFTEVKSIHRITPDIVYGGKKRKVWAIVREAVIPVFSNSRSGLRFTPFTAEKLGIPVDLNPHSAVLEDYGDKAADFWKAMEGLWKYKDAAGAWHQFGSRSKRQVSLWMYPTRESAEWVMEKALDLFSGPVAAPLGQSLEMLASHGIYLRDVHRLNIGWHVARDDNDWSRIVIFDPGHTPTDSTDGIEEHLVANSESVVVRPVGWQAANDEVYSWARAGHFYRGMSEAEWRFIQEHQVIRSDERYSLSGEGTNFSDHPSDAESYTNFGSTDPRKTGKPNYLIEVENDGRLTRWRDGYWKAPEVPASLITRAWIMYPEDGAVMAKQVALDGSQPLRTAL